MTRATTSVEYYGPSKGASLSKSNRVSAHTLVSDCERINCPSMNGFQIRRPGLRTELMRFFATRAFTLFLAAPRDCPESGPQPASSINQSYSSDRGNLPCLDYQSFRLREHKGTLDCRWQVLRSSAREIGQYRAISLREEPLYLTLFTDVFGLFLIFEQLWYLVTPVLLVIGIHWMLVTKEEPDLEKRFGESYVRYKETVPRWIPGL